VTLRSSSPRRGARWSFLAFAVLCMSVLTLGTVLASHPEVSLSGSDFEIDTDANLKVDDPAPSEDWAAIAHHREAGLHWHDE